MKRLTLFFLFVYKRLISPNLFYILGRGCRYTPTCSEYASHSIQKYGVIRGGTLALGRFSRCHPFSRHYQLDPVPDLTTGAHGR